MIRTCAASKDCGQNAGLILCIHAEGRFGGRPVLRPLELPVQGPVHLFSWALELVSMAVRWNYASGVLLFHPFLVLQLDRPPLCAGKRYILAVEEVLSPLPLAFIFGGKEQAQLPQLVHFVNFGPGTPFVFLF